MNYTSPLVKVYAVTQGLVGLALLFTPESAGVFDYSVDNAGLVVFQLVGAAFLGFGMGNWTARESILGGIYGRAVVTGNQTFSFIGATVVISAFPADAGWSYFLMAGVLIAGMILFSILQFRPDWLNYSK